MRFHILAFLPICVSALVTFLASHAAAAAKDETYSAYAAQNQVTEAILSRDSTTFMTFATERGKTVLRGWRISGSDAALLGRIELKDLRTPTRTATPYPYSGVNKDFASLRKSFALSPSGDRIARLDCGHVGGLFADTCERLVLMDWRGKTVASIKDTKKDSEIVPGARPCGIEFSPDGQRLYVCTEGASFGFQGNSITYHDEFSEINAFDSQLKKIDVIALGPTERPKGSFPGRAQIEGFYVSSNNMMVAYGHAYATKNMTGMSLDSATPFDKSEGSQVWRINLASGKVEYHYAPTRPADAESYKKAGNYLADGGHYHAVLVGPHLLRGFDDLLLWSGEVFGESRKPMPRGYATHPGRTRVSDDGRVVFGENYGELRWMIVGHGAGPVDIRGEWLPEGESVMTLSLAPGTYKGVIVTNRRVETYEDPATEAITAAEKYAKGIELIETGFFEAGVKETKEAVSAMPPAWTGPASNALHRFTEDVSKSERALPLGQVGEILRHAAGAFYGYRAEGDTTDILDRAITTWMDFGLLAAQARNPIVLRQVADKIEPMIAEWKTKKASTDTNRDTYDSSPLLLRGLATAIEKSPDSAYDYLLAGGGLKGSASYYVTGKPHATWPLYANLTKLAYVTGQKVDYLELRKPKTPPSLTPVPYPDVDGKLIPALTVYSPGAAAGAATTTQPGNSVLTGTVPPPAALGAQVLD